VVLADRPENDQAAFSRNPPSPEKAKQAQKGEVMADSAHYVLLENYDPVTGMWFDCGEFHTFEEAVEDAKMRDLQHYRVLVITATTFVCLPAFSD